MANPYPRFMYFPRSQPPPEWVEGVASCFRKAQAEIDTSAGKWGVSDVVLGHIRAGLEDIGFQVEGGKRHAQKIHRPVFFGEQGIPSTRYEVDAYHPEKHILLEVEAGRAIMGNALYRDIVHMSLIAGADYAVIGIPLKYTYKSGGKDVSGANYEKALGILDTVWGTDRLRLPFKGMLLIGF
jgi:hypothetical protein